MTPALPEITDDDRQFLHYNPNTNDLVEWVQQYALQTLASKEAEIARLREALGSINDLYDDKCNSSQLASRMYDASCIARVALTQPTE